MDRPRDTPLRADKNSTFSKTARFHFPIFRSCRELSFVWGSIVLMEYDLSTILSPITDTRIKDKVIIRWIEIVRCRARG